MNNATLTDGDTGSLSLVEVELRAYLLLDTGDDCKDPVKWWGQNKDQFPTLSKLVLSVFSIPASSSTSERVFSQGSLVCSAKRTLLKADKIEDLVLLKLNETPVKKFMEAFDVPIKKEEFKRNFDIDPEVQDAPVPYPEDIDDESSADEESEEDVENMLSDNELDEITNC